MISKRRNEPREQSGCAVFPQNKGGKGHVEHIRTDTFGAPVVGHSAEPANVAFVAEMSPGDHTGQDSTESSPEAEDSNGLLSMQNGLSVDCTHYMDGDGRVADNGKSTTSRHEVVHYG